MATWMVHFRIADKLMSEIRGLSETEFVVGNVAPDSGVPNEDWSAFTPPTAVSHFCEKSSNSDNPMERKASISPEKFKKKYIDGKSCTKKELSFYLGYYVHLLTDVHWRKNIALKEKEKYLSKFNDDQVAFIWAMKEDWYDLDHLFLKKNPQFRAFNFYEKAKGFRNIYMEEFPENAFAIRQEYIVHFYREEHDNLERDYPYLTEQEMELFVDEAALAILEQLKENMFDSLTIG